MAVWKDNNTLRPGRLTEENLNSTNKSKKVVAKNKKHLKQLRLQISRMKRAMKRNSKKYKLRRRHHLENRKRGIK